MAYILEIIFTPNLNLKTISVAPMCLGINAVGARQINVE